MNVLYYNYGIASIFSVKDKIFVIIIYLIFAQLYDFVVLKA